MGLEYFQLSNQYVGTCVSCSNDFNGIENIYGHQGLYPDPIHESCLTERLISALYLKIAPTCPCCEQNIQLKAPLENRIIHFISDSPKTFTTVTTLGAGAIAFVPSFISVLQKTASLTTFFFIPVGSATGGLLLGAGVSLGLFIWAYRSKRAWLDEHDRELTRVLI